MKKSLSLLLSAALVFGSFGSLAYAADADLTVAQKYQALKDKGILKGTTTGSDGLEDKLNRAQFATIAIALAGLSEEKTGSTFSDVTEKQWWYGAIEAAAKAGLVEGSNGKFDPKGDVTVEQVIVIAARILKLEEAKDAKVEGASAWAAGYIQAAIDKGLVSARTDYTKPATRGQAIEVGYQAYVTANPVAPEKASVTTAKATGIKKVEVTLDKAVDTAKATLSLKKGTLSVATTTKWSDDKKSATLELTDVVIGEGEYTVTLGGLDAAEIATATAKFTAEKEQVKTIEFVNTNDTVARSNKNIIKIKASNQYGENAAANPGSYTVYAGLNNDVFVKLSKDAVTGELLLTLDTTVKDGSVDRYQAGSGIIAVNIFNNDSHVSASKNFKMGTAPYVTKLDISPVKYSNGKDFLGSKGENAVISVNQFDQYGNILPYDSARDDTGLRFVLNGYEPNLNTNNVVGDSNNDDIPDIKLSLLNNVDKSAKFTFNVNNQAGTASGELSLQSSKTANKVEFGDIDGNVAAGDSSAYLPVIAYDANGDQLSVDDLVNAQNAGRISFSVSTGSYNFVTYGENKGKLQIGNIPTTPKQVISVTAIIATANASSVAPKLISVQDARVPAGIKISDESKQRIVLNGKSDFKFIVIDQYGKELNKLQNIQADGSVTATPAGAGNNITSYEVAVTATASNAANIDVIERASGAEASVVGTVYKTTDAQLSDYNKGFAFDGRNATPGAPALAVGENATFAAYILKVKYDSNNQRTATEVAKIFRKIEATTDTLNYTVGSVSDLFNAIDSKTVVEAAYGGASNLTVAAQEDPLASKFAKEVSVSATDAAGNTVAIPNTIKQVTSSDSNVAVADTNGAGKGFVIGNGKGTANLNVTFETSKGLQVLKTISVNTKDDALTSTKIDRGNGTRTLAQAASTPNAFTLMNVKVTDNYGVTYEGADAQKYNRYFGVTFTATNVKVSNGTLIKDAGSVTIDQYGNISTSVPSDLAGYTILSYELTATTAKGFSASTFVS